MPRYGYMLEANGKAVGVILVVSSLRANGQRLFSNLSGWYVEPEFRGHATRLFTHAIGHSQTTYLNVSVATHIRPIIEAFGFQRYSEGQFLAFPALARNRQNARTRVIKADRSDLDERERRLLESQASYGCISFCVTDGRTHPFVFLPRTIRRLVPCVQLVYCRDIADLIDMAGTVGRYLLLLGRPFVLVDANGRIPGLSGKYFPEATPKYYKGPLAPQLGDLTETEATIFGIWSPANSY
jgi:hypothetical protein